MNMHTLILSDYDADKHQYKVKIGTDIGQFTGETVCQEVDYPHENSNVGYDLAEMKATIQYAKAKRKDYTSRAKGLQDFLNNMKNTRTFSENDYWVKQCLKEIRRLQNQAYEYRLYEERLKNGYRMKIIHRDEYFKRHGGQ